MLSLLNNARISSKLLAIGVIAVLALSTVGGWAMTGFATAKADLHTIAGARAAVEVAVAAELGTKEIGVTIRNLLLAQTQEDGAKAGAASLGWLAKVDKALGDLRGLEVGDDNRDQIDAIRDLWSHNGALVKTTVDASQGKLEQRALFFKDGAPLTLATEALVAEVSKDTSAEGLAAAALAQRAEAALAKRRLAIWRYLAVFEPGQLDEFHRQVAAFNDLSNQLRARGLSDAGKAQLAQVVRLSDTYDATGKEVVRLARTATEVYMGQATQLRKCAKITARS